MSIRSIKQLSGFNILSGVLAFFMLSGCDNSSSNESDSNRREEAPQVAAPIQTPPPESYAKGEAALDAAINFNISDPGTLGINVKDSMDPPGMIILEVAKSSQAEKFGLLQNDVILKIDESIIGNAADFKSIYKALQPKISINISLLRNGKISNVDLITP